MGNREKTAVELQMLNAQYLSKIKQSQQATTGFTSSAKQSFTSMRAPMLAVAGAVASVVAALGKSWTAANEQLKVEKKLDTVLKSTGHAAGLSATEIKNMAASLQDVTTFGDETIIASQNLLLTFKSIGKDVFPEATEAVLNMGTALGGKLAAHATTVGKALEDPIQGVSSLRRVGVQLTDQQTEQVKKFVEINDKASAQKIILAELESQYGGMARAMAKTPEGRFLQLKNTLGDISEEVGKELMPGMLKLIEALKDASKNGGLFKDTLVAIGTVANGIITAFATVVKLMNAFSDQGKMDYFTNTLKDEKELLTEYEKKLEKLIGTEWKRIIQTDERYERELAIWNRRKKNVDEYTKKVQEQQAILEALKIAQQEKDKEREEVEDESFMNRIIQQMALESMEAAHEEYLKRKAAAEEKEERQKALDEERKLFLAKQNLLKQYSNYTFTMADFMAVEETKRQNNLAKEYHALLRNKLGLDSAYAQGALDVASTASTFMADENKAIFTFGKGLALVNVAMNTAEGITKAFAQLGPLGGVGAGIVAAAGALQAQKIIQQQPPSPPASNPPTISTPKLAEGGYIPGSFRGTMITAGEGGRGEAVIPLENPEAMAKLGGIGTTIIVEGSIVDAQGLLEVVDNERENRAAAIGGQNYYRDSVY